MDKNRTGNFTPYLEGQTATSDAEGYIKMFIPLERQSNQYRVECPMPLESDTLSMPTTESTSLVVK